MRPASDRDTLPAIDGMAWAADQGPNAARRLVDHAAVASARPEANEASRRCAAARARGAWARVRLRVRVQKVRADASTHDGWL